MIIGITGLIGSGKDTVAKLFVQSGCVQDSFASPLKDMCASIFGWDREMLEGDTIDSRDFRETPDLYWTKKLGIDSFTPRLALQLLGTDIMRTHFNEDIWLSSLEYRMRKVSTTARCVVVSDARFVNELSLIKDLGGIVINVKRDELPEWYDYAYKANVEGHVPSKHIMTTRFSHVHQSEWNWIGFDFDYEIENNSTLEDLSETVTNIQRDIFTKSIRAI